jgi:pimeloyl-ACP methyl ester carboxylesterase
VATLTATATAGPRLGQAGLVGRRWGAGDRRIVLVHGLGVAGRMMAPLARCLAASATVLAPDLPGYGAAADRPPTGVAEQGSTVAAAVRAWGGPTTLVGCSYGSQVALAAAEELGEDLEALVLVSPTVDRFRRSLPALAPRYPLELATQPQALRRIQFEDHATAGLRRAALTLLLAIEDRPEDRAPGIVAPTLLLRGTRDPLVSTRWVRALGARFRDGTVALVPGRHAMTFTEPELVADAMDRFLGTGSALASPLGPASRPLPTSE